MKTYQIFDLETVRDPEIAWSPPDDDPGRFPPVPAHRIVACGVMTMTRGEIEIDVVDETEAVEWFSNLVMAQSDRRTGSWPVLVGWNSRHFDVPVLVARTMRRGLPIGNYFSERYGARYRYQMGYHIDLLDQLTDYGAASRYSLEAAASLIGVSAKTIADGKSVDALVSAGELDAVRAYCAEDVAVTAALFCRWQLVSGAWNADTERAMASMVADELARVRTDFAGAATERRLDAERPS